MDSKNDNNLDAELIKLSASQFIEVMMTGETMGYVAKKITRRKIPFYEISNIIVTENIIIDGGDFETGIEITHGQYSWLEIRGGVFLSLRISGGTIGQIILAGGEFHYFLIYGGNFGHRREDNKMMDFIPALLVHSGEFEVFSIRGGKFFNTVSISGGLFNFSFTVTQSEFLGEFNLSGGIFKSDINIEDTCFESDIRIEKMDLHGNLNIKDCQGSQIVFSLYTTRIIRCVNLAFDAILFSSFQNTGDFQLINVYKRIHESTETSTGLEGLSISVKDSILGGLKIIGCNWEDGTLTVDYSEIIDVFYTDTQFPIKVESVEENKREKIKQIQDTYSQLKTIADRQNDRESSLEFQAKSNEQIYQLKKLTVSWFAFWEKKRWERLQLWMSKVTNNFGTDYSLALRWLILGSMAFFSLYMINVVDVVFTLKFWEWPVGDYLQFLNPLRDKDFMCPEGGCNSQFVSSIDAISRVAIGYWLYQFIQAFRKYGKK